MKPEKHASKQTTVYIAGFVSYIEIGWNSTRCFLLLVYTISRCILMTEKKGKPKTYYCRSFLLYPFLILLYMILQKKHNIRRRIYRIVSYRIFLLISGLQIDDDVNTILATRELMICSMSMSMSMHFDEVNHVNEIPTESPIVVVVVDSPTTKGRFDDEPTSYSSSTVSNVGNALTPTANDNDWYHGDLLDKIIDDMDNKDDKDKISFFEVPSVGDSR